MAFKSEREIYSDAHDSSKTPDVEYQNQPEKEI